MRGSHPNARARPARSALLPLALVGVAVALAACAQTDEEPVELDDGAAEAEEEELARLDLAVSLTEDEATDHEWTLVCRDAADADVEGDPPADYDPEAACAAVEEHAPFLVDGPDPDRVCTQEYGGPEEADVDGTVGGEDVALAIDRTDGCGIDDWERLAPLLGEPGAPAE